ncbi:hypothetical protein SJR62_09890 [Aeromonas caviae]|uniref:hypothetical protein n=1 Tax=Aeromonas TaxID=642 RepID=UPI000CDBC970|nr:MULTISPECIES: hypothetical protein [Aeromonas]AUZ80802.1 hypothetical protein C2U37_14935 [Aeromonas sp. ASNIH1]MDX7689897.1 hypothetical protein [Aeromonas caviae]MDX7770133.1 hypothetical protein [Aeromonas caviae]MDX7846873.1 hypothetical protein [Aeromonas caviae]
MKYLTKINAWAMSTLIKAFEILAPERVKAFAIKKELKKQANKMTKRKGEFDREIESLADIVIDTCGTEPIVKAVDILQKMKAYQEKKSDNAMTVAGCRHTIR